MKKGKLQIDTYSLVPVLQNVLKKKRQMRVCMCVFTHFLVNIDSLCLLCVCVCVCVHSSHVQLFATPWTAACQTPLSMEFSRQEY